MTPRSTIRSSQTILAGCAVALGAAIIGCGGSGDNGFNNNTGTLTNTTGTTTATTTTGTTTATTTTGTTGGPTTDGVLPKNEILFTTNTASNGFLNRVKPDGSGRAVLSQYASTVLAVAPSPVTSGRYVFVSGDSANGPFRVFRGTAAADPATGTILTTQTFASVTDLAFSPDGTLVFFVGTTTANASPRLYKLAVPSGNTQTTPVALDLAVRVAVSPVGQRLVYSKENGANTGTDVIVLEGYDPASTKRAITTTVGENSYAAFDRTGTKIVYSANTGSNGSFELFTANAAGGGITQITNTPALDEYAAAFNGDGTRLAYSALSQTVDASGIYASNVNGTGATKLVADASIDLDVYWTSNLGRDRTTVEVADGFGFRRPVPTKR